MEPSAFLKISALGVEEKRVRVIADFAETFQQRWSLGDGFRIEAKLVVDQTPENTIGVPTGMLFRQGDAWQVYRIIEELAEPMHVEVGRSNGMHAEILSGINASDLLILHPTDSIQLACG